MIAMKLIRFVCLLALVCAASGPAHAQGIRLFAMGSGSFLLNEKFFAVSGDQFRSNYARGGKVIFGGELSQWKILGIEASYAFGRNNLRVADLEETPPDEIGYGTRLQRVNSSLVAHSPIALLGWRPYLTAGLEYSRFSPTSGGKTVAFTQGFAGQPAVLSSSNKVGFSFGGGLEWSFFPTLALRLDLRNHSTGTPKYGLPSTTFPVSGGAHNVELSAGFVFHLGS